MEDIKVLNEKSRSNYFSSIVFFLVVIISTIIFYFYNNHLKNNIKTIQEDIVKIEKNIKEVESDKSVQIYSLIELNKKVINSYEAMNNVTKFINHMNVIKWKYKLEFYWFDLFKWEINTNIKIISNLDWLWYQKTRDFIREYRLDKKALFDLSFVNWVEWMDEINFKVNFKIK